MIPVLVLTHGSLALELREAALKIVPELEGQIEAIALPWEHEPDVEKDKLRKELRRLQRRNGGVVIVTDMFGGTASNIALPFLEEGRVEIVTGINLPMLMKLASLQNRDLGALETAEVLQKSGKNSIRIASTFLKA